jgi:hypothetical protein
VKSVPRPAPDSHSDVRFEPLLAARDAVGRHAAETGNLVVTEAAAIGLSTGVEYASLLPSLAIKD